MFWKLPPKIKIYEALGSLADERVEPLEGGAKVYSSSRKKFYTVTYDKEKHAIMANDNGSFWQGYLGYPAIAYLMQIGEIEYDKKVSEVLKGIEWKEVNTKFKNNYDKTIEYVHALAEEKGVKSNLIEMEVDKTLMWIESHPLKMLGKRIEPPKE
ncbi:MAG: hypothetical protein HZA95_03915 [Candidatus Vogelbacteria bacterium]|nr:hypothetical protein [Candidatus Vogelbacteria bacterium]